MSSSRLYILQNIAREGPGLLQHVLEEKGIPYQIVRLEEGETPPPIGAVKALVVLGGPDSANDPTPKIQAELAFIGQVLDHNLPYLGICLGLQLMVRAAGGLVVPCPSKEVGFRDADGELFEVTLTETGRKDPLLRGLPDNFPIFHLHGETVQLTPEMHLLGTGKQCRHQIVKVGSVAYGIQGHLELTKAMLQRWLSEDPDLRLLDSRALQADFSRLCGTYTARGRNLLANFLSLAGFS
ncbi:MAG: type 1 glutamine amidotransferase [Calditrichaeota bacterium]|nr:MAG: type 1 glutamine amidotransferase [Calditrichota bacterium]